MDNHHFTRVQCTLVETALTCLVEELTVARNELHLALDDASACGYEVADDGSVTYPPVVGDADAAGYEGGRVTPVPSTQVGINPGAPLPPNPHIEEARRIANRVGEALRAAETADTAYAQALARLETSGGLSVTDAMWEDTGQDTSALAGAVGSLHAPEPPNGLSPQENRAWWDGLTTREKDFCLALHPAEIGALDGLPAEVRDMGNRAVLEVEQGRLGGLLAEHMAGRPGEDSEEWDQWNDESERLSGQLRGIEDIQARFEQTGVGGLPEAYLLGFSTEGDGRVIIANGNPDSADHTAVYVPGTSTDLTEINSDITRATQLWRESDSLTDGTVSTVMWYGYDAPDELTDAAYQDDARDAAPLLNGFLDGLTAAQGGAENSHTTVIGHSYGSTVIGAATQEAPVAADDIIAVGSPGMLVHKADDLGVGEEHVWSLAASVWDDPVPLAGILHGENDFGFDVERGFGGIPLPDFDFDLVPNVPSSEDFGATIMVTDSGHHGGYWDKDSESLMNQSRVIVGAYGDVVRE
ncbi:alpha/beta hydrolase [Streptomyces specialis]|uniref:alpha/beta hydrolase n=1 Tax=Streptomyces specialis TaxID=498367 RepID=UPI00131A77CC|nr:alpha/beta hydrolase [Streptomyces specialis]